MLNKNQSIIQSIFRYIPIYIGIFFNLKSEILLAKDFRESQSIRQEQGE